MDTGIPSMVKEQVCLFTTRAYGDVVKVVLPLQYTEVVPEAPPMNLSGLPTLLALGTVAHDITTLEDQNINAGLQLRINAMVKQEIGG